MFYNIESLAIKKTFVDYSILTTIPLFSVNISSVNTINSKKKKINFAVEPRGHSAASYPVSVG